MPAFHARSFSPSAIVAVSLACSIACADAHSWLDCLDWDVTTQTCNGYPRNWAGKPADPFGTDRGRDNRPSGSVAEGGLVCIGGETMSDQNKYTPQFPRATLAAGQDLVVRWPAKNHANVGVQRGVQLFISKAPDGGDDFSHITDKAAYLQQCAAAGGQCEQSFSSGPDCQQPGVDKAECMATFRLPSDLSPGVYTLMWWWEFNAGEYYNSCADALVTNDNNGNNNSNGKPGRATDSSAPSSSSSSAALTAVAVSLTVVVGVALVVAARRYRLPPTTSPVLPTAAPHALRQLHTPCPPVQPPPPPRRTAAHVSPWTQHKDPASGQFYWFNAASGVSTWERPSVIVA